MRRREFLLLLATNMMAARAVRAQQKAMPVIGFLGVALLPASFMAAFRQGLNETGYVEGQTVAIEFRWSEGRADQLPALTADLIFRKVDVIVTVGGTPPALAAKNASSTMPIVFVTGADPVEAGLVATLARPGGNLTGASFISTELMPKRVELLSELVPRARAIALVVNPNNPIIVEPLIRDTQERRVREGCSSRSRRRAPKARSTPLLRPSSNCKSAASSSPPMGSFPPGASSSPYWHHATQFRPCIRYVITPKPAA